MRVLERASTERGFAPRTPPAARPADRPPPTDACMRRARPQDGQTRAAPRDPAAIALRLLAFCEASDWSGFDPYDALNSKLLAHLPLLDHRLPRIVVTQILKRSPVNVRPLLGVPKTQNPKGVALFLAAILMLWKQGVLTDGAERAERTVERLAALRSPGSRHWCWGYSFPWQTRTVLVPRWAPNLVCTTFAAHALLDVYDATGSDCALAMAQSAGDYLRDELYRTDDGRAYFAYPLATSRTPVHNATLLAAALLCRLCACGGDDGFRAPALEAARYAVSRQRDDGSWPYGESPTQYWIDNFHTGFNLCALHAISRHLSTGEFEASVERGFAFYVDRFFRDDGAPCYFHDRTYPIDVHAVAQSIITLVELRALDPSALPLANTVFDWAMQNLWQRDGYFAYQRHAAYLNRIPYMRWSQAWMLLAIATLVELRTSSGRARTVSRETEVAP